MTHEGFRLSPQQEHLWALHAAEGGDAFRCGSRVEIRGPLDRGRLQQALDRLVHELEILRTYFVATAAGGAEQVIRESGSVRIADARDSAFDAPFDLESDRLLRVACVPRSEGVHDLHLSLPGLCADRESLDVFTSELARAYEATLEGPAAEPAAEAVADSEDEAPLQYADVAEWQQELLESEESEPGRDYWRRLDLSALTTLVVPFQETPGGFAPLRVTRSLAAETVAATEALASRLGVSTESVLFTAWAALLRRLSNEAQSVLGLVCDGRELDELAGTLGPLARSVPVGVALEGDTAFEAAIQALAPGLEVARRWQACFSWDGFGDRAAALAGGRAFLPYSFEYATAVASHAAGDVSFRVLETRSAQDRFVAQLSCLRSEAGYELSLDVDSSALKTQTAERLAGQFEALLADASARPATPLQELDALAADERQALLIDFNDTDAEYRKDFCAHQWIEEQAQATPDAIAVRQNDETLTYRELDERANQLAHHLQARGVGPDILVALCIERTLDMAVGILGILKAGGAYVPIDPAYPEERLRFLLEDTRAPVLLTQESMLAQLPTADAEVVCMDSDRSAIDEHPRTAPRSSVSPSNLVYVIYTSGSTGKPKGVVITHEKLVISNTARVNAFGHTPSNFLLLSSVAFDSSVVGIFWALCGGGTLFLIPEGQQKDIAQIPRSIAQYDISHLLTLPSFYRLILDQAAEQAAAAGGQHPLAGMHTVIVAGEACPLNMVEVHKAALPGVGLFSEYGATETTVFSSVYDCLSQTLSIAPVGGPIENAQMYVLDERLTPCPTGVPGEVHFGGIALAVGYLNREQLTAERFVPNPFGAEGTRLYKSGDLARHLENGDVEFLGRLDNQVKIRGYRIELEEIEAVLLSHPGVKEAAVLALTDLSAEKRLIGYVVPEGVGVQPAPSVNELRAHVQETLPEFMTPAVFVFMDDFPRTPNGKTDRKALPEPGSERPELESEFAAPCSAAEVALAGIWSDVLGLERIGVDDNFFELGGDSILSIQVVSRAKALGLKLSARQVFEHQTIRALVAVAEVTGVAVASVADQGPVTGAVPLTPVQRWFFELGLPQPAHWNMPMLLDVVRPLDAAHLEQALGALCEHHDALRLRFQQQGGEWSQEIAALDTGGAGAAGAGSLVYQEDLSSLPEAQRQEELERRADVHHGAMDLQQGPLMRAVLFDIGQGRKRLLWFIHHLAVDGVSWRILLEDLDSALAQLERSEPVQLPRKTTSFKAWSEGLLSYAQSDALSSETEFWSRQAGRAPASAPPVDHADGENIESSVEKVRVALDAEQTRALLSEVPSTYNTQINDILLTAYVHACAEWTGASNVLLNLEGHGREDVLDGADLSRTVGWFTTDYPVLLADTVPFEAGAAIRSMKEQLRAVPNNGFGYGVARHLSQAPVPAAGSPPPALSPVLGFNYLGQFDQLFRDEDRFRYCEASSGAFAHPDGPRVFQLEVYGMVSGGRLELDFEFSRNVHERSTVQALADSFLSTLRALIEHCLSPEAGGFTTSDFSDFAWGDADLSSITDAIQKSQSTPGSDAQPDTPSGGEGGS